MTLLSPAAVRSAADRLRGHLVQTPLIGSTVLAGDARVDVRWKADLLQPGGSGWYRGYLHLLLRSFGALPGLLFAGPVQHLLAAAVAAQQHRLPFTAFGPLPLPPAVAAGLAALGGTHELAADPLAAAARLQRRCGHLPLPGAEHPEIAAGLATVGLELGGVLPAEVTTVYAPAVAAAAVAAGLAAAGRSLAVLVPAAEGVEPTELERLCGAIALAHRLTIAADSAAVLHAARQHPGGGVVGAVVLE